jgi:hypothetical protein
MFRDERAVAYILVEPHRRQVWNAFLLPVVALMNPMWVMNGLNGCSRGLQSP